jgi:hypothetical protein
MMDKLSPETPLLIKDIKKDIKRQKHESELDVIKIQHLLENQNIETIFRSRPFSLRHDIPAVLHTAPTSPSDVPMWYWNTLRLKSQFTY